MNESSLLLVQSKRGVSGHCTPQEKAEKEPMVQSFFSDHNVYFTDRDIYLGVNVSGTASKLCDETAAI